MNHESPDISKIKPGEEKDRKSIEKGEYILDPATGMVVDKEKAREDMKKKRETFVGVSQYPSRTQPIVELNQSVGIIATCWASA